jgi:hypothetical protein
VNNRLQQEQGVHFRKQQEQEATQKEEYQGQIAKLHLIVKQLKLVIQKQKHMETLNNSDLRGMMNTNIKVAETIGDLVWLLSVLLTIVDESD